jgi:UDP-2,3-diacylglucosamine pyrophosphatase LpxH
MRVNNQKRNQKGGQKMARTKALFLSDIHLSSQERYEDREFPAKYKREKHEARLIKFLERYLSQNRSKLKDVVLLGDIFDTWACPVQKTPPTVDQIVLSNPYVINAFNEITSAGARLLFVEGNHDHDSDSTRERLTSLIDDIIVAKHYLNGRIYATHGNEYDIFNKLDYFTDPANGRPVGYFITRLSNTIPGGADALRNIPSYFDDLLEAAFTRQNLFSSIIEALAEKAGLSDGDEIVLPFAKTVSIRRLKEKYQQLDNLYATDQIMANLFERRYMDVPADRLCHENQYKVVVFGHTHNNYMDKDWLFVDDRIYANTGSWCIEEANCVEVDYRPAASPSTTVRLLKVLEDGSYTTKSKEAI